MANALLGLILGCLAGFYAKELYSKVSELVERFKASREYEQAGIVKPQVTKVIPQVDLTTSSGVVRRPTPDEIMLQNIKERDAKLKRM